MMTLEQHVEDVRAGIRLGRFPNEAAVSQGVVLRLLNALGWPTWDTQIVWPEYALEGLRVDFALCHPPARPKVFVEVKQVGQSDGAERQLFEYAFHKGVPLAILTDGREWSFFLPAEAGDYPERRVYKLDVLERDADESTRRFQRYLNYEAVCSGSALAATREDYADVARSRQVREALPEAWRKLIQEEDELLIEILADRVESLCGYKPDPDTVAKFLAENVVLQQPTAGIPVHVPAPPGRATPVATAMSAQAGRPSSIGFVMRGRAYSCRNARDVLVSVIEAIAEADPTFVERFATLPKHGRTRRYIALNRDDLYPGRPDLVGEHSHKLRSGYWLGINVSRMAVERIITMACEVAGLRYGFDLVVNLG